MALSRIDQGSNRESCGIFPKSCIRENAVKRLFSGVTRRGTGSQRVSVHARISLVCRYNPDDHRERDRIADIKYTNVRAKSL